MSYYNDVIPSADAYAGVNKYTWRCLPGYTRKLESTYGGCFQWPIMTDVVQFSTEEQNYCAVRSDGRVQCW